MSDEGVTNTTEAAEDEGLRWFEFPGWRWSFFNITIWLMPVLLVFGILFNILCFITIYRNPKTFPKISRRSMMIITACDVIVLSIGGTFYYHVYWQGTIGDYAIPTFVSRQSDSPAACYFINYFSQYLLNGTPLFHAALTLERVLAVVMPLKVKQIMTVRNHCIMLVVLFLLGSIAPVLWTVEQEFYDGMCDATRDHKLTSLIDPLQYNFDFYLSKVSLFIFLLSGCIIVAVSLTVQSRAAAKMSINSDSSSKRGKLVGTCSIMIFMNVVFFLTHAPRAALSVYEGFYFENGWNHFTEGDWNLYYRLLYGLIFLHNILDPFAYFIGKGFRKAFKQNLIDIFHLSACLDRLKSKNSRTTATSVITENRDQSAI